MEIPWNGDTSKNGLFWTENPINMDDFGVPLFEESTIYVIYKV